LPLILLSLVAVAVGLVILMRLMGGSLPWGRLKIAVGPDGRPMRPRVKWHLWSISRGESPLMAAVGGLTSLALGFLALAAAAPRLSRSVLHPITGSWEDLWVVITVLAILLTCTGLRVLVQAVLDMGARRSSMLGTVVGMRRDLSLFGATFRIAVQAGDRAMTRRLFWADSFRVDRKTFKRLSPGDRVSIEYSPHLRHVYRASEADRESGPGPRTRLTSDPLLT
jgi:hypothetical protein